MISSLDHIKDIRYDSHSLKIKHFPTSALFKEPVFSLFCQFIIVEQAIEKSICCCCQNLLPKGIIAQWFITLILEVTSIQFS